MKMKNLLKKHHATIAIATIALLGFSGCVKDPELNNKPTVKVPSDKIINLNETFTLTATATDKDKEDILTYLWRVAAKPKGSQLSLTNATNKTISFKADKAGTYYFDFIAKDEYVSSKPKRVTIIATSLIGTWTADLIKTKEESKLNESETAELVETLSANYKFVFLENGKVEGADNTSWRHIKDGNYELSSSKSIQLTKENQLFMIGNLKSGKELKFYYKRAYKK